MAEERIKRCDWQGCNRRGKKVDRYRLDMPGGVWTADLCSEHATPLREFLTEFPEHFFVKVRAGGRATGIQIHTIEEIEALKELDDELDDGE